jgi:hypothetical protein
MVGMSLLVLSRFMQDCVGIREMFLSRTSNHCVVMRYRNTKSELEQLHTCNKKELGRCFYQELATIVLLCGIGIQNLS